MCYVFYARIHLGANNRRLFEPVTPIREVEPGSRTRELEEAAKTAPKINSGATDGGYLIGRPTDPESRPAKTKKAKAGSHFKLHGLETSRPRPMTKEGLVREES